VVHAAASVTVSFVYEQPNRSSALWVWLGAAVLVIALTTVGVVTVLVRDRPARTSTAPLTSTSLVPTGEPVGSPTPSSSSLHDPCVIGSWTETSNQTDDVLFGTNVFLTSSGATQEFRADGTGITRYPNIVRRGSARGSAYEIIHNGTISFNWQTSTAMILYSNVRGNGTTVWKINGKTVDSRSFVPALTPDKYTCTGDSMRQFGDDYAIELTRNR
jgi:hypothetical protein